MQRLTICSILATLVAAGASPAAARPISPPAIEVFTVRLEHEIQRYVTVVEPHGDGYVYLLDLEGQGDYVPRYRIRSIQDAHGSDLTHEVLERGRRLGPPQVKPPRDPEPWKPFRFRGGPASVCDSYMITEFAMLRRIGDRGHASDEEQWYWSIDLGYARNVGRTSSVGLAGFFGADGARAQAGLRLRLRRWLTHDLSLDLAPGIVLAADEEGKSHFLSSGFAGQAGLSLGDRVGATVQVFSIRRESLGEVDHETAWHAGIRLGSEPGVAASVVFLFAAMIYEMNHPSFAVPRGTEF